MNTERIKTQYLGDGVYANVGNYRGEIILTTGCHIGADGVAETPIYLDPPTARSLYLYLKEIFETTATDTTTQPL
jgi:hypothetical protein